MIPIVPRVKVLGRIIHGAQDKNRDGKIMTGKMMGQD
jgi:hypothetical protein